MNSSTLAYLAVVAIFGGGMLAGALVMWAAINRFDRRENAQKGELKANLQRHLRREEMTMGDVHEDFSALARLKNGESEANVQRHLRRGSVTVRDILGRDFPYISKEGRVRT